MNACRLLILDDDPMIGTTIQVIAEASGAEACLTTEPDDFFSALANWRPTHVCTDLNMPTMDGLQVLAELAKRGCTAQIIISSGVGQRVLEAAARSGAEQGLQMGGVLPKPFTPADLRRLLHSEVPPVTTPAPLHASPAFQPNRESLELALSRREFTVAYQPKVDCASGGLAGLEALVRWQHPVHGTIVPDRFIQLAEDLDLIDALTVQVLDMALGWFVPWRAANPAREDLTMSVNLSARSLGSSSLVSELHQRCQAAGLPPSRLVLELTETAAMDNPVLALELLTRLRVQGFQLAIDDFGTGYSSMVQLVRLPFSEVKVDRSFVMTAARSDESRAVIRSIIGLGHSLGLSVTAEGVEDAEALSWLREIGCDQAQGFFIARPMPASDLEAWVEHGSV
jgi:EAL domain-containing protein (putative c-di-GMP-specific phosphodiesterase class I)/ActR/RegA family two-component response regulator